MRHIKLCMSLFFHSIFCFLTFRPNESELEWLLFKLTVTHKYEKIEDTTCESCADLGICKIIKNRNKKESCLNWTDVPNKKRNWKKYGQF